ncbi:unnamed protein product [Cunninghamella blakesleeana]
MAKGLQSHTKKKTRAIKRTTVFKPVEDSRLQRLAIAQADAAKKPSVGDHMKEDNPNNDTSMMDTSTKVSTGGFRSNKQKKAFKLKKSLKKKTTNKCAPDLSGLVIRHTQSEVGLKVTPILEGVNNQIVGKLYICESLLYFYSDTVNSGIAVEYPDIIIHAISRQNGEPSIYCQLDAGLFFPTQQVAEEDKEDTVTELNFTPIDTESLEDIYLALSECASLHPDQEFMAEQDEFEDEEYYTNPGDESELNEVQQAALRHLESVFEQPKQNGTDHKHDQKDDQFENAMEDD